MSETALLKNLLSRFRKRIIATWRRHGGGPTPNSESVWLFTLQRSSIEVGAGICNFAPCGLICLPRHQLALSNYWGPSDETNTLFGTGVLTPTYEGQVKWRYTDNDLAWADQCFVDPFTPPPNAGSWGFGWNGKVTSLLETTHTFMGKAQWTWRTCADIDASPVSANIRLQGVL